MGSWKHTVIHNIWPCKKFGFAGPTGGFGDCYSWWGFDQSEIKKIPSVCIWYCWMWCQSGSARYRENFHRNKLCRHRIIEECFHWQKCFKGHSPKSRQSWFAAWIWLCSLPPSQRGMCWPSAPYEKPVWIHNCRNPPWCRRNSTEVGQTSSSLAYGQPNWSISQHRVTGSELYAEMWRLSLWEM